MVCFEWKTIGGQGGNLQASIEFKILFELVGSCGD